MLAYCLIIKVRVDNRKGCVTKWRLHKCITVLLAFSNVDFQVVRLYFMLHFLLIYGAEV